MHRGQATAYRYRGGGGWQPGPLRLTHPTPPTSGNFLREKNEIYQRGPEWGSILGTQTGCCFFLPLTHPAPGAGHGRH